MTQPVTGRKKIPTGGCTAVYILLDQPQPLSASLEGALRLIRNIVMDHRANCMLSTRTVAFVVFCSSRLNRFGALTAVTVSGMSCRRRAARSAAAFLQRVETSTGRVVLRTGSKMNECAAALHGTAEPTIAWRVCRVHVCRVLRVAFCGRRRFCG